MTAERTSVLVADDDADVRLLLTVAFESQADFELVGCVADGRAALEAWRRLRPNLFVVDYRMPEMDGLDVVRHVLNEDPGQVVVMFSANPTVQEPAHAAGVTRFVLKGQMMTLPNICRDLWPPSRRPRSDSLVGSNTPDPSGFHRSSCGHRQPKTYKRCSTTTGIGIRADDRSSPRAYVTDRRSMGPQLRAAARAHHAAP